MAKVEDLVDFYLWMVHNDYDHTIRSRVEKRAEEYLIRVRLKELLDDKYEKAYHSTKPGSLYPSPFNKEQYSIVYESVLELLNEFRHE